MKFDLTLLKYFAILMFLVVLQLPASAQDPVIPSQYRLILEVFGDLDHDGAVEKAVVYDLGDPKEEDIGIDRELIIFKKNDTAWKVWQRSKSAIGNSREGGMMGDPFQKLEIKNGLLIITHAGGSSWKWDRTDKYRFQHHRFELIGFTSSFGKLCEYWSSFDFNLQTGRLEYKKQYEKCDDAGDQNIYKTDHEFFIHTVKSPITLQHRKSGERKIITPRYKEELYY